ncbi:MAG: hypothetical protein CUN53_06860 [Phototrophicales bacterium]|nr:MAG: hypothetical protein CUN53_06860 [Phototrophicales bacterium]
MAKKKLPQMQKRTPDMPPPRTWKKQTLRMKDNHTWKAPDGYNIIVVDRGALRFNVPKTWHVEMENNQLRVYDAKPPDDEAGLIVTVMHLPPGVDWTGLPLNMLLEQSTEEKERVDPEGNEIVSRSEIVPVPREDIELVWNEVKFIDAKEKRPAFSRHILARGFDVAALITFSYWEGDEANYTASWEELLRSIELGRYVDDPTRGDVLH